MKTPSGVPVELSGGQDEAVASVKEVEELSIMYQNTVRGRMQRSEGDGGTHQDGVGYRIACLFDHSTSTQYSTNREVGWLVA